MDGIDRICQWIGCESEMIRIRMASRILITVFAEIWNILGGTGL